MSQANPIIVVTGANGGVGFGICEKLLLQLSSREPSDALPQKALVSLWGSALNKTPPIFNAQGMTLIMACRSRSKAEIARTKLCETLDAHIKKQRKLPGYDGHADLFREGLKIEIHDLDLAVIQSVFRFGAELSQKYPYVSHLICNAGVTSMSRINWPKAVWQLCTDFVGAVTAPDYFFHTIGKLSADGLGWVWQCNVFGHYCLFRSLQPLLSASKPSLGARVLWTSSIEASPTAGQPGDWQLVKTEYSYAAAKYQMELIATHLDGLTADEAPQGAAVIRHVIVQPGVVHTNIDSLLVSWFTNAIKIITFYMARMLGSPNHTIQAYKAAFAAVHLSLISLTFFPAFYPRPTKSTANGNGNPNKPQPMRFKSESDRWGTERVGVVPVLEWEEHEEDSIKLVEECEKLYQQFRETEGTKSYISGDTGCTTDTHSGSGRSHNFT